MKMPGYPRKPIIDANNPMWCPSVSRSQFVQQLARYSERRPLSLDFRSSFPLKLDSGLRYSCPDSPAISYESLQGRRKVPIKSHLNRKTSRPSLCHARSTHNLEPLPTLKRKRNDSLSSSQSSGFADLIGPRKRVQSILSYDSTSFILSDRAEPLQIEPEPEPSEYSPPDTTLVAGTSPTTEDDEVSLSAEDELERLEELFYGPRVGPSTPGSLSALTAKLENTFPGMRLRERVYSSKRLSHQSLADFLGQNGLFNPQVLSLFRRTGITSVSLTESMRDTGGLNEGAKGSLIVFSMPRGFQHLSEIILDEVCLRDADINHILLLPSIQHISLVNTGIGDGAIFRLTVFGARLTILHLADNFDITDDSIPALMEFKCLELLNLVGTGITPDGLRRFAIHAGEWTHQVAVSPPISCWEYLDRQNATQPITSRFSSTRALVSNPEGVDKLSLPALRKHLAKYAAVDSSISLEGSCEDLRGRLKGILEIRNGDRCLRSLIS